MASFTENYNLIKPGQEDIYNIGDFNDNADIIDAELKDRVPRTGDISNTQIATFDTITEAFPVPAAGEATRTITGKIRKFIQDFNNFKTGILTVGMLVNNAVTNNSQLPVSAAVAKVLQDQVTQLNSNLVNHLKVAQGESGSVILQPGITSAVYVGFAASTLEGYQILGSVGYALNQPDLLIANIVTSGNQMRFDVQNIGTTTKTVVVVAKILLMKSS